MDPGLKTVDCSVCGAEIKTGLLGKIRGTYIKKKGKKYPVCSQCQKAGEDEARSKIK